MLNDFNLKHLKKDMNFIEDAISASNVMKKKSIEFQNENKVPKRIKNLRYFLRKKRNIVFK